MPHMVSGDVRIHYEVEGAGEPVLLLAPGGMRSTLDRWDGVPWNPRVDLRDRFRLISMDQRNAGSSTAPVEEADGWHSYTADQLALLDHLQIDRCHVVGMCIGGPFILALLTAAPDRFWSAVLLQPVGVDDNRAALRGLFDDWSEAIAATHPEANAADLASFGENMWGGDFVLTATRSDVAGITTPMLVLMGDDLYHPQSTSRAIAELAPHATLIERWKDADNIAQTASTIRDFLMANSPTPSTVFHRNDRL